MLSAENSSSDMAERDWMIIKALVVKEILSTELTFKLWSTWKFNGMQKWVEHLELRGTALPKAIEGSKPDVFKIRKEGPEVADNAKTCKKKVKEVDKGQLVYGKELGFYLR